MHLAKKRLPLPPIILQNENINILLAALLLLAACTRDDDPAALAGSDDSHHAYEGGLAPITFTLADDPDTRVADDGLQTRFENGDQVAVQCDGVTKTYTVQTVDGQQILASDDPFMWDKPHGNQKTVTAWYPADATIKGGQYTVKQDQRAEADFKASHVMATDATPITPQNTALRFTHRTAKIVVKITPSKVVSLNDLDYVEVRARPDLSVADPWGRAPGYIQAHRTSEDTWEAMVPQQDIKLYYINAMGQASGVSYLHIYTKGSESSTNFFPSGSNVSKDEDGSIFPVKNGQVYQTNFSFTNRIIYKMQNEDLHIGGDPDIEYEIQRKYVGDQYDARIYITPPANVTLYNINLKHNYNGASDPYGIINISGPGEVRIRLEGYNYLYGQDYPWDNGYSAILLNDGASLVLTGPGSLTAEGAWAAVIGTGYYRSGGNFRCGDITIVNATLDLTTSDNPPAAPAIGKGAQEGGIEPQCGNITVYLKQGQSQQDFLDQITLRVGSTKIDPAPTYHTYDEIPQEYLDFMNGN